MSGNSSIPRGRRAAAAIKRLQRGDDFDSWRDIAMDIAEGRQWVIALAGTSNYRTRVYRNFLAQWEQRNPWSQAPEVQHPVCSYLLWWADHIAEVDTCRAGLSDAERTGFNHPSTIWKAFHGGSAAAGAGAGGGRGRRVGGGGQGNAALQQQIAALQADLAAKDAEIAARDVVIQSTRDAYDQLAAESAAKITDLEAQLAQAGGRNGYHYMLLQRDCTETEITAKYRLMAKIFHPDKGDDPALKHAREEHMKALNRERDQARRAARTARGTP
jgi:hypothetical protein